MLKPIERMWEICENSRMDSDTAYFHRLMLLGEMVAKVVVSSLLACINDDKERSRYGILYNLVRAHSLGGWSQALDSALSLPGQQYVDHALLHRKQLQERVTTPSWQFESVDALRQCLADLSGVHRLGETTLQGKQWLHDFVQLRNRTRGRGATPDYKLAQLCEPLERSIKLFTSNYAAFGCEWVYLRRALSGKYKTAAISSDITKFQEINGSNVISKDGVYTFVGEPRLVELVQVGFDPTDIYIANGNFKDNGFECLSYISDNIKVASPRPYIDPPQLLPSSETEGRRQLDIDLSNLPEPPSDYVHRPQLEKELKTFLIDDYPPIITLVGRGGIGKTSLALSVLRDILSDNTDRFDCILWFSARDIDLLPEGPKRVQQNVLDEADIAAAYVRLVSPLVDNHDRKKPLDFLIDGLRGAADMPICCFVLDYLETVSEPQSLYRWLYTNIRPPNKLLITTRQSGFKADWPITIPGMSRVEFDDLVDRVAGRLGVLDHIDHRYRSDMFDQSAGHPYVVKVLLGQIRKTGGQRNLKRVMASEDDILEALFERTFSSLSLACQRAFLTLSQWRSVVPRVAVEAVLMRPSNDYMRVGEALDELEQASMIDILESERDSQRFVSTPVAAALFGRRQLLVSPMKSKIDSDVELLREFGTADINAIKRGIDPHIGRFVRYVASSLEGVGTADGSYDRHPLVAEYGPMLEYIARKHYPTWLMLAELYEELLPERYRPEAQGHMRRYIMAADDTAARCLVWRSLAHSYRRSGDISGELHALSEMCKSTHSRFSEISEVADHLNAIWQTQRWNDVRTEMARLLLGTMCGRLSEARANDYSRIAWLCIHLRDFRRAARFVRKGLSLDPANDHLVRLAARPGIRSAML